eukprot:COSAG02_NODE_3695_length_6374_cov_5.522869_2_plen_150_part_00
MCSAVSTCPAVAEAIPRRGCSPAAQARRCRACRWASDGDGSSSAIIWTVSQPNRRGTRERTRRDLAAPLRGGERLQQQSTESPPRRPGVHVPTSTTHSYVHTVVSTPPEGARAYAQRNTCQVASCSGVDETAAVPRLYGNFASVTPSNG